MTQIRNFEMLMEAARAKGQKRIAVAAPYDDGTLSAIKDALDSQLAQLQLFGNRDKILRVLEQSGVNSQAVSIVDTPDTQAAIKQSVQSVRNGENHILMKGAVQTSDLLRASLDRASGLSLGRLASHIMVLEVPGYDRLLLSTDGGLNIAPTLAEKADIIHNAVDVARALGIEQPKVACIAALEMVNPKMPATMDAAILSKMADRGVFGNTLVDGPLALDNILSAAAAKKKGIHSPVAGYADILLSPSIEVGNVFAKALTCAAHALGAGIVAGTAAPIILPSRSSDPKSKYASLALGVLLAK